MERFRKKKKTILGRRDWSKTLLPLGKRKDNSPLPARRLRSATSLPRAEAAGQAKFVAPVGSRGLGGEAEPAIRSRVDLSLFALSTTGRVGEFPLRG